MADSYVQKSNLTGETHFTSSPTLDVDHSRMTATPLHLTTFNGGDLVPIYYKEILPSEEVDLTVDAVVRQTTMLRPVFGELDLDIYAFFVPNRVVNKSWVNTQGENSAGAGISPDVELAPLFIPNPSSAGPVSVPVGSVADYYGFPTQKAIPADLLGQMNDLKFRGYVEIWNEYFRDQNYQAPIPYSKLNIYEGFMQPVGTYVGLSSSPSSAFDLSSVPLTQDSSGSFGDGAVVKEVFGEGLNSDSGVVATNSSISARKTTWSALDKPLKVNKLHDYFTSVLPYPQKGASLSIMFPSEAQVAPLSNRSNPYLFSRVPGNDGPLKFTVQTKESGNGTIPPYANGTMTLHGTNSNPGTSNVTSLLGCVGDLSEGSNSIPNQISGTTLVVNVPAGSLGSLDISELRTVIATQQVFEVLARCGSRYREVVQAMFGISVDDPYKDIPEFLGHIRRTLNNYQVAQTSPSQSGGTPQANLAAYSYTATGGQLFHKTFFEHGYVHVFAVVRQKNLYSTLLWADNFRRSMLDYYLPPLANISEQPVPITRINPWATDPTGVFGYQEAWAEYRYEPDRVSGYFRSGLSQSLSTWVYLDEYDPDLAVADGSWITSNAQESIDPTLAVQSLVTESSPQFFAMFAFKDDKTLPMPTYSVPGLDIF